jgi:type II secretory pathway component PulK
MQMRCLAVLLVVALVCTHVHASHWAAQRSMLQTNNNNNNNGGGEVALS